MTVLGSGLVFRAVIPGERGFVAREFQQDDLFIPWTLQHFLTSVNARSFTGCFWKVVGANPLYSSIAVSLPVLSRVMSMKAACFAFSWGNWSYLLDVPRDAALCVSFIT